MESHQLYVVVVGYVVVHVGDPIIGEPRGRGSFWIVCDFYIFEWNFVQYTNTQMLSGGRVDNRSGV